MPPVRPMGGIGMWIYGLLFLLIIGWSWFGSGEAPVKTNWNDVEKMIAAGDVESIEIVNKEQANVRLKTEAVEKYTAQQQYRSIPKRGTQFIFNIGDVATFRQDLDRVVAGKADRAYGRGINRGKGIERLLFLDLPLLAIFINIGVFGLHIKTAIL